MPGKFSYVTKLDIKFDHMQLIDIPQMVKECKDKWFNQSLTKVNDSVVRLGIVEGDYHWHKHDHDDEFFFVLDGQLLIDLEDHTIELNPNQGVTISKGVMHRPRAPKKTVMLMVETITIEPTGNYLIQLLKCDMKIEFADLTEADLELVREIYNYYIVNSTATYYTEIISVDELKDFIPVQHKKYKSYMIMFDNQPCGFCYISQYKKRQAYDRTAELSLYLKPEYTGRGIGKVALEFLEQVAKNQGISVLIGIISGDNENSIKLFENKGYEKCAHYKQIGEKFNKILDVVSYQKMLA